MAASSTCFSDDEEDSRWNLRIDELLSSRTLTSTQRVNSWALTKFATWVKTSPFPYVTFQDTGNSAVA